MSASDHWIAFHVVEDYDDLDGKWFLKDIRSFRETDRTFSKKGYSCIYQWKSELVVTKVEMGTASRYLDKSKILKRFRPLSLQVVNKDDSFWEQYNIMK
jgi:hypothetical protein